MSATQSPRIGYPLYPRNLRDKPLWLVQKIAADRDFQGAREAVAEMGHRFANAENSRAVEGRSYWNRLVDAFVAGFDGVPCPYEYGLGGNFVRPMRRGYKAGAKARAEIDAIRAEDTTDGEW